MQVRFLLASAVVGLAPNLAAASPVVTGLHPIPEDQGRHVQLVTPDEHLVLPGPGGVSNIIFLNRCVGDCTITKSNGAADARTNMSPIPSGAAGTQHIVAEFAHGDANWQTLLSCVQAVYAPYDVIVTDVDPGGATLHHEAIVAGVAANIGQPANVLGVGNLSASCTPYDNGISFAFANAHGDMENLCWTVAQEVGHTYGLDHVYDAATSGISACYDPMTYTPNCGRKYFRNRDFTCGEYMVRACRCSSSQNSHVRMLATFGTGAAIAMPTVNITVPMDGAMVTPNFSVFADAQAVRGVGRVELWLNGFRWLELAGRQPDAPPGVYTLTTPGTVPNGIIDVEVRGYDDLGIGYGSDTVTVTKGAACVDATSCAAGQQCENGRCFWDPPVGILGADCAYDQYCLSGVCKGVCTEACFAGVTGDCPAGFECVADGPNGFCFEGGGGGGGCCSTGDRSAGALLVQLGFAALVLGGALRRRRRR